MSTDAIRAHQERMAAELNVLVGIVDRQLRDEIVQETHRQDIALELSGLQPGLAADVAALAALGEHDAADQLVSEGLAKLKTFDPLIFKPAPSDKLIALTQMTLTGNRDFASVYYGVKESRADEKRRGYVELVRRAKREGRESELPAEINATFSETPTRNLVDGVRATRFPNIVLPGVSAMRARKV